MQVSRSESYPTFSITTYNYSPQSISNPATSLLNSTLNLGAISQIEQPNAFNRSEALDKKISN